MRNPIEKDIRNFSNFKSILVRDFYSESRNKWHENETKLLLRKVVGTRHRKGFFEREGELTQVSSH